MRSEPISIFIARRSGSSRPRQIPVTSMVTATLTLTTWRCCSRRTAPASPTRTTTRGPTSTTAAAFTSPTWPRCWPTMASRRRRAAGPTTARRRGQTELSRCRQRRAVLGMMCTCCTLVSSGTTTPRHPRLLSSKAARSLGSTSRSPSRSPSCRRRAERRAAGGRARVKTRNRDSRDSAAAAGRFLLRSFAVIGQ